MYRGMTLTLGGDVRCDSPGFSAKRPGSYTPMGLDSVKVLEFQLVHVRRHTIIIISIKYFLSE